MDTQPGACLSKAMHPAVALNKSIISNTATGWYWQPEVSRLGYCPTQSPNVKGFALCWNIDFNRWNLDVMIIFNHYSRIMPSCPFLP